MRVTEYVRPALAAAFLVALSGCGTSSAPDTPSSGTATGTYTPAGHRSANALPVAAAMPDVIGGNAGRAAEQSGPDFAMTFEDVSGRDRAVDDPAAWTICRSQPGPNQQITDYPVVFGVVRVSESCRDAAAE